ncbi:hypothetical protein B0T25DRAFT_53660, partial [Lasiosphaeria hispida]
WFNRPFIKIVNLSRFATAFRVATCGHVSVVIYKGLPFIPLIFSLLLLQSSFLRYTTATMVTTTLNTATASSQGVLHKTDWRTVLTGKDTNWVDRCELITFGDLDNPEWWLPFDVGDSDRLRFPTFEEHFEKEKRDAERRRQSAQKHLRQRKARQAVQLKAKKNPWY